MIFAPVFVIPLVFVTLVVSAVAALVVFSFAVVGGPGACEPGGGPIEISRQHADAFDQKWDTFDATLDAGAPASVTFSESELSSRAQRWINDLEDDAIDADSGFMEDIHICLYDGKGEASGRVDLPGFLDIKIKVRGSATITDELVVNIDDFEIGSVPGFVEDWLNDIPDEVAGTITDVDLEHTYIVSLREGEVQIDGRP